MKNFETKLNMAFAILFAFTALFALYGVFYDAWWQWFSFIASVALSRMFLTARDDSGDSAWKHVKRFYERNFKE